MLRDRTTGCWLLMRATVVAVALAAANVLHAQEATPSAAEDTLPPASGRNAVTRHTIDIQGTPLRYTATVASLGIADETGTVKARFVYTSYVKDDGGPARPLTFAFNGGPGAASVYLHLGALGPHRLVLKDDGTVLPPPAQTAPNPHSWLAFTDLVFVDPVGTGRSRPAQVDGKPVPHSDFWGVEADVNWTARFVRQYVSQTKRWSAPKFLVGESYGGFRAARLAQVLPQSYGLELSGVLLVSPVIDFGLSSGSDRVMLWPAVLRLPTFAAVAWHHGRVGMPPRDAAQRDNLLAEVEAFALAEMLPALAQGPALAPERREALYARVAGYIGLPVDLVRRADGRVGRELFLREVLREEGRVVGRYDASLAMPDPDPAAPSFSEADPSSQHFTAPLLTAMNAYLETELKVTDTRPYVMFNRAANSQWNWRAGQGPAAVGAAAALRSGMIASPALRVHIAHGRFDLIAPYFASTYILSQLHADPALRRNITMRLYDGGHMMYFHRSEREALWRDAAAFYAEALQKRAD